MPQKRKEKVLVVLDPLSLRAMEIKKDIERISAIISLPIFFYENFTNPLRESAFVELMICLNDLLTKIDNTTTASGERFRVAFTDNIVQENDINDITDLVTRIRNAVCHISSDIRNIKEPDVKSGIIQFTFNTVAGKNRFDINGFEAECEFEDDLALYYGTYRIYLKHHIYRAFDEALEIIEPLLVFPQERPTA